MFTKEFYIRIFIDVILISFISVGFGSWLNFKYDKKLIAYEPLTAERILKNENHLNSKREVFFELIQIINKVMATSSWNGPDVQKNNRIIKALPPTELEINNCYAKLNLYVDNNEIIEKFPDLFKENVTPVKIGEFINLLRNDLGFDTIEFDPLKFTYIFLSENNGN